VAEPNASLVHDYPGLDVCPTVAFRAEWGPIFHRGRLDGTARVLVIGQDPAASEDVTRRILVGEAGHRLQGLLAKLARATQAMLENWNQALQQLHFPG
jgi:uracil-DNA glycosylase